MAERKYINFTVRILHDYPYTVFGATSSATCANYAMRQTAKDNNAHLYSDKIVQTIAENFYMDNCLKFFHSVNETITLSVQLTQLLKKGGFHLTKWLNNSREILQRISQERKNHVLLDVTKIGDGVSKVFGVKLIIKGAATVRKVLAQYLQCKLRNAPSGQQFISELPKCRLTPNKPPFYFSVVKYFVPFIVKQARSNVKRWDCIFACLTTRVVHAEVTSTYSRLIYKRFKKIYWKTR